MAPLHLRPGTRLDRYELVDTLGEGGMGTVWRARHRGLDKLVALKTLRADRAGDARTRTRFLREGRAAARIRHPHVVEVFDVGEHDGVAFLVMELLEGDDLRTHLTRRGRLEPEALADLLVPVCAAAHAAHAAGVVHRDLKPENIFLARSPGGVVTPKVLDFGISRIVDDAGTQRTSSSALLGTPHFMAPEQARGAGAVDARSDVYALGVILYLGATGRLPFDHASPYELLRRVVHGECEAPSRLRPELAGGFEALVLRAMALDPDARFPTASALGEALLPFAGERVRLLFRDAFRPAQATLDDDLDDAPTTRDDAAPDAPAPRPSTATDEPAEVPTPVERRRTRAGLAALVAGVSLASGLVGALVASPRATPPPAPTSHAPSPPTQPPPSPPAAAPPAAAPPVDAATATPSPAPSTGPAAPVLPLARRPRRALVPAPRAGAPHAPPPTTRDGLTVD